MEGIAVKHYRVINRLAQHLLFDEDPKKEGFTGSVVEVETENLDWFRGPDGFVRLDVAGHPLGNDRRYRFFDTEDECAAAGYVLVGSHPRQFGNWRDYRASSAWLGERS